MGLKEGTLESLVESRSCPPIADSVFHHMLQALDCLASMGIVHRDVKPENILYISQPGDQYQFQLGDFGLCNRAISATTTIGSPIYMAPEMFRKGDQTHKVDIWLLLSQCCGHWMSESSVEGQINSGSWGMPKRRFYSQLQP